MAEQELRFTVPLSTAPDAPTIEIDAGELSELIDSNLLRVEVSAGASSRHIEQKRRILSFLAERPWEADEVEAMDQRIEGEHPDQRVGSL